MSCKFLMNVRVRYKKTVRKRAEGYEWNQVLHVSSFLFSFFKHSFTWLCQVLVSTSEASGSHVASGTSFPAQGLNPGHLHWKHGVSSHCTTREVPIRKLVF